MDKKEQILILAAHADDIELGMGATVKQMTEQNKNVFCVIFSPCFASNENGLYKYVPESYKILGIDKYKLFGYEVRKFSYSRQQILEDLVKIRKYFNPDKVFIPASTDIHQDHEVVHKEAVRAFENRTLLGYSFRLQGSVYNPVSEKHIKAKFKASNCYLSQIYKPYFGVDYIQSLAIINGLQCNAKYAESFEAIKIIL